MFELIEGWAAGRIFKMFVVCSWCKNNKPLREVAPFEDKRITHGICKFHEKEMLEELKNLTSEKNL